VRRIVYQCERPGHVQHVQHTAQQSVIDKSGQQPRDVRRSTRETCQNSFRFLVLAITSPALQVTANPLPCVWNTIMSVVVIDTFINWPREQMTRKYNRIEGEKTDITDA